VFRAEGGRLGARMTMYSMLMVLRWEHNVSVMIDKKTMEYMGQAFDIQDPLPVLEDTLCSSEVSKLPDLGLQVHTEEEIMSRLTGHILWVFPESSTQPDPARYRSLWSPEKLFSSHAQQMKEVFSFHGSHLAHTEQVFSQLASLAPGKAAIFVGVHARRTDYPQYSRKVQGVKSPGAGYYREAMDHYLEEYHDPHTMVWFLVSSDDKAWAEKNILKRPQTVWAGSDDPGRDLAILASCNHSVTSQGNYGSWAAFLAGGDIYTEYGPVIR